MKPLPLDAKEAAAERKAALDLGRKLLEPLATADVRLKLAVQVHVDAADVREGEISGGPLVDVEAWLQAGVPGFRATAAATEGLAGY